MILAAGRGSRVGRVGDVLHKSLLPLNGRAVLSHQLERVPRSYRVVIAVGYRADQVRDYVALAHPDRFVEFVDVAGWDRPGGGPGASLLACRDAVGDDDVFVTSCDTLWAPDPDLLVVGTKSWLGTAAVPPDTLLSRWCVAELDARSGDTVIALHDKVGGEAAELRRARGVLRAYVGLAYVARADASAFWDGVATGDAVAGERQVTGGLAALAATKSLALRPVSWTDVGDERSYRQAVARYSGYDWTKSGQATYVLPDAGRVIKFNADPAVTAARRRRGQVLRGVPDLVDLDHGGSSMLAYRYVPGRTVYAELDALDAALPDPDRLGTRPGETVVHALLAWHRRTYARPLPVEPDPGDVRAACHEFYWRKTQARLDALGAGGRADLAWQCRSVIDGLLDLDELNDGAVPTFGHGDFNFGNVLYTAPEWRRTGGPFVGLDWREDFAGHDWIDVRYDLGKLLAGCYVHWDAARRGDFRPWPAGERYAELIRAYVRRWYRASARAVEIIGALSLLNCAPLHAAPLDEILVARGCAWLTEVAT